MLSERIGVRFDFRYFRNIKGVSAEDLEFPVTRRIGPPPLLDARLRPRHQEELRSERESPAAGGATSPSR